jgi:arginine decarboxylase
VLEQLNELDVLLKVAGEMGVEPTVGVRIKLATEGSGRWAKSGGEKSKFGLSAVELVQLLDRLTESGMQGILKLVHFHLGSQITDIRIVKAGLEEVGRYYVELRKMGFEVELVDVGGGLGVDYDGSRSTRSASMNYTMREYANDVVYTMAGVCRAEDVPMPDLISESGRAITAHHALLLLNVIDCESQVAPQRVPLGPDAQPLLLEMQENLESFSADRTEEVFHDAVFSKERAQEYFASGVYSLRDRADAEQLYLMTLNRLAGSIGQDRQSYPEIVAHLETTLVDRYFCNFSLFQSLPDNWAIDQLFPVMPIHRLNEPPSRHAILGDISCDSDGKIDQFIDRRDVKRTLPLHPFNGQPYYLATFLVGAYQEILGDLHNLFGDTNAVHVTLGDSGEVILDTVIKGDTVREVLDYVQFRSESLLARFRRDVEVAVREGKMGYEESGRLLRFYEEGLQGYTYLEDTHER